MARDEVYFVLRYLHFGDIKVCVAGSDNFARKWSRAKETIETGLQHET